MDTVQDFSLIKNVLDKYFNFLPNLGFYSYSYPTELIPPKMLDIGKKTEDGEYSFWLPLSSTVTEAELIDLEIFVSFKLPNSYRYFLKQRYFLELQLGKYAIGFFKNLPQTLVSDYISITKTYFGNLKNRSFIPFAKFMDFGVLCFDANKPISNNEYPIVLFDHEDGYTDYEFYAENFLMMFSEFDIDLDEWIKNYFEKKMADFD